MSASEGKVSTVTVLFVRIVFLLLLLLGWHALSLFKIWPSYLFPSPSDVFHSLRYGFSDKSIPIAVVGSLYRLVVGYSIALILGLFLGLCGAQSFWFKRTFGLLVMGLQSLPSVCWLPLALLWFGLNQKAIIFVVVMGAVFSIAQSTEDGIRNTAPVFVRAARNLGAHGAQLYLSVILPASLPSIATGMKLGWSFAWRSLMAGEILYALPGLGNLLSLGRELNDMSQVLAIILVIMILGFLSEKLLFAQLESHLRDRWGF